MDLLDLYHQLLLVDLSRQEDRLDQSHRRDPADLQHLESPVLLEDPERRRFRWRRQDRLDPARQLFRLSLGLRLDPEDQLDPHCLSGLEVPGFRELRPFLADPEGLAHRGGPAGLLEQ